MRSRFQIEGLKIIVDYAQNVKFRLIPEVW
jgi:hypothetical protein